MKKYHKIIKFILSGGSAAFVEYSSFIMLISIFNISVIMGNSLSFLCGLIVSFLLNKYWVFGSTQGSNGEFLRYLTLALLNLAIGFFLMSLLINVMEMNSFIAKVVVMMTIAVWNYMIFSKLIFKNK
jgi:putative flippase GtrA